MSARLHRCIYCGCDELHACVIEQVRECPSADWSPAVQVGCSWVRMNPWICSAPACLEKANEQELLNLAVFRATVRRLFP
jgi:hypothetical protein